MPGSQWVGLLKLSHFFLFSQICGHSSHCPSWCSSQSRTSQKHETAHNAEQTLALLYAWQTGQWHTGHACFSRSLPSPACSSFSLGLCSFLDTKASVIWVTIGASQRPVEV